jgi:DNA repair exonuclease SbcCD nuclease subunit
VPRLLHTADWQIGRAFNSFQPESAVPLAQARLDAVKRLAELATEHQVDAVLVAGDVFDAQTLGERTVRQLFCAPSPCCWMRLGWPCCPRPSPSATPRPI